MKTTGEKRSKSHFLTFEINDFETLKTKGKEIIKCSES